MGPLNSQASFNLQVLDYAEQGELDKLKELVSADNSSAIKKLNWNWQKEPHSITALFAACLNGHKLVVDYLLSQHHVDPNLAYANGRTPFLQACFSGNIDIVRRMMQDSRVNVNQAAKDGITPFCLACGLGYGAIVRLLLTDDRVEINKTDEDGCTPFYKACSKGHEELVKLLLRDSRIHINLPDKQDLTPFAATCKATHLKIVQQLMQDPRIEVNAPDDDGCTPFYAACINGNIDLIRLLLTNDKVDIQQRITQGKFPLFVATANGFIDIIRQILISGREIDLTMKDTVTDLTAIEMGRAMANRIKPLHERKRINGPAIADLLDEFARNPDLTRKKIKQLYAAELAASLFALVIFYTDNFMDFAKQTPLAPDLAKNYKRFFNIAKALPLELQMLLCNIAYDRNKDLIPSKDSEGPFRNLANNQLMWFPRKK